MYDWLLFIHIVAAMVWIGGSVLAGFFAMRAGQSRDPQRIRAFASDMVVAGRIFSFAALVILVAGVLMVVTEDFWEWENTFIIIGFAGVLIGGALGGAFYTPQTEKVIEDIDADRHAEAGARLQRIGRVAQVELVLLLVVVFSMVANWGV
ncbi:MAG: DUF2269 family protein [Acidimicrobiia bacterium]|nr:DUF2269 family protein [Acidimicrobiia bacterium]